MGSSFKAAIFQEHIQENLDGWVQKAKRNKGLRKVSNGSTLVGSKEASVTVELAEVIGEGSRTKEGSVSASAGEIEPATPSQPQEPKS